MRKIVDYANVTAAVLLGAYLVLLTLLRTPGLRGVSEWLASSGLAILSLLVGAFLLLLNLNYLLREWRAGGFRRNVRVTSDQGMNEISIAALEALLLRNLRAEPDIVDPQVLLTARGEGKPMLCQLELKLRKQDEVIRRMDAIKRKIRDDIDRLIPGGLTVEVEAEVRDFVSEAAREKDKPVEQGEFNGPVYSDVADSDGV